MTGSLSTSKVIVYKKANPSESGGLMLISNQQAPSLGQYSESNVKTFVNRVKTQHASGVACNISAMIPMGTTRNMLRNNLILKKMVSTESEFEHILTDPTLFLSTMDNFLKKLNLPTGAPTDLEMIREKLMFDIDTVLNDVKINRVIEQISSYDHDCRDVYLNLMNDDQQEYIKVLIEQNSQKHLSKCQKKLFALVKLNLSKFNTIGDCCGNIIEQITNAADTCHNAYAFGMSYSSEATSRESQDHDSKKNPPQPQFKSKLFQKQGGQLHTASNGGKSSSSSFSKHDKKKQFSKSESSSGARGPDPKHCTICGILGHESDVCRSKDQKDNTYLNFDDMPYKKSPAWHKTLAEHPNLLTKRILDYPRYLTADMRAKLSGGSSTSSHKRK